MSHRVNPDYVDHWETPDEFPWFEYVDEVGENHNTSLADCLELARAFGLDRPAHHQGLSISPDDREWYVEQVEKDLKGEEDGRS